MRTEKDRLKRELEKASKNFYNVTKKSAKGAVISPEKMLRPAFQNLSRLTKSKSSTDNHLNPLSVDPEDETQENDLLNPQEPQDDFNESSNLLGLPKTSAQMLRQGSLAQAPSKTPRNAKLGNSQKSKNRYSEEEQFLEKLRELILYLSSEIQKRHQTDSTASSTLSSPSMTRRKTMLPSSLLKQNKRQNQRLEFANKDNVVFFNKSWDLVLCLMIGTNKALKSLYDKVAYQLQEIDYENKFSFEFAVL